MIDEQHRLLQHGLFTWGATQHACYLSSIRTIDQMGEFIREHEQVKIDLEEHLSTEVVRAAGVPMAIASDHNPGSSPGLSLLLMLNMACTLFRLTPEEALRGMTVHGARALGLADRGRLVVGQRADFAAWALEQADLSFCHSGGLDWNAAQALAPMGEKASVADSVDARFAAVDARLGAFADSAPSVAVTSTTPSSSLGSGTKSER